VEMLPTLEQFGQFGIAGASLFVLALIVLRALPARPAAPPPVETFTPSDRELLRAIAKSTASQARAADLMASSVERLEKLADSYLLNLVKSSGA
jgi:hypothetical protein